MTVRALAERASFWMIYGREMSEGDPQTPCNRLLGRWRQQKMSPLSHTGCPYPYVPGGGVT
jgi:hypothetical protein